VEHKLYWGVVASEDEARYLEVVLNSESARRMVAHLQSRGQWGARDFDKVMLSLPIPEFDASTGLHAEIAAAGAQAEEVAAQVGIDGVRFVRARGMIREALADHGIGERIEFLVSHLLGISLFALRRETMEEAELDDEAEPDEAAT
jgi:hypothetical protein